MSTTQTAAITAQNTFTAGATYNGHFNLSIWGTFVATVFVQRSFDGGTTWLDVASYTGPVEDYGFEQENALYRAGVKTGGFTSGTVNVRLSR